MPARDGSRSAGATDATGALVRGLTTGDATAPLLLAAMKRSAGSEPGPTAFGVVKRSAGCALGGQAETTSLDEVPVPRALRWALLTSTEAASSEDSRVLSATIDADTGAVLGLGLCTAAAASPVGAAALRATHASNATTLLAAYLQDPEM